ncbi:MAG: GNAT family N-acetyltransferase [Janthinobacterium lividum]
MTSTLQTQRSILRNWRIKDLKYFVVINQNPYVMKYSKKLLNTAETMQYYEQIIGYFKWHKFGLWAVELKDSNRFIGYYRAYNSPLQIFDQMLLLMSK